MNITAIKRGPQTKGERKIRMRQGFIPGSIYGKGLEPVNIEVNTRAIAEVLTAETGLNTVIDLMVEGDALPHSVLVDHLERNPITRSFMSVGFHQVKKSTKSPPRFPFSSSANRPRSRRARPSWSRHWRPLRSTRSLPTCPHTWTWTFPT